mmetsp:Transcript_53207/g.161590  ORF Transcript_53207/g.161590 Transcript_53207/m.161590 type:complete len:243 (-) Transcript_53207:776-1504(-)
MPVWHSSHIHHSSGSTSRWSSPSSSSASAPSSSQSSASSALACAFLLPPFLAFAALPRRSKASDAAVETSSSSHPRGALTKSSSPKGSSPWSYSSLKTCSMSLSWLSGSKSASRTSMPKGISSFPVTSWICCRRRRISFFLRFLSRFNSSVRRIFSASLRSARSFRWRLRLSLRSRMDDSWKRLWPWICCPSSISKRKLYSFSNSSCSSRWLSSSLSAPSSAPSSASLGCMDVVSCQALFMR